MAQDTPLSSNEPVTLPLLPLRDVVVFPHMVIPLFVGRPKSIKALARKTGARGLRSILEQTLLDVMYDLPSLSNLSRVIVDESTITHDGKPLLMFADPPKVASAE